MSFTDSVRRLTVGVGIVFAFGLALAIVLFRTQPALLLPAESDIASPDDAQLSLDLFHSVNPGGDRNVAPDVQETLKELAALTSPQRPLWPVVTYLRGELHRQHGELRRARDAFRALATWAVSDYPAGPYGDTWGGSGLAAVALWRWLQIEEAGDAGLSPAELDSLLEVASQLQRTRLYTRMVNARLLPALPQLDEQVRRLLAQVAWNHGRLDDARALYLDFMAVDFPAAVQDEEPDEIRTSVFREGLTTAERQNSYAARRRLNLPLPTPEKERAAALLKRLHDNPNVSNEVRAAAGYEWAYYMRQQEELGAQRRRVLTRVIELTQDEAIKEQALYRLGRFTDLVNQYPTGRFYDDALKGLADNRLYAGRLDEALERYERLREIDWPHDYEDSAYLSPALGLIARGSEADLDKAASLLRDYLSSNPEGVFRLRSLFWLGRVAERRGDERAAKAYFNKILDEAPYNYYALRARMHLEHGEDARLQNIPAPNSDVRRQLRAAYEASRQQMREGLTFSSPYHERFGPVITVGLHGEVVQMNMTEIDGRFSQRLDNIPLAELDRLELIPAAAMLLALRQDAMAAMDREPEPENRLELAGLVTSSEGGVADWPLSLGMTSLKYHSDSISYAERRRLTEMQRREEYLATAYPNLARFPVILSSLKNAAWEIDGSRELSVALMYAVARRESRFYSDAISPVGAMGLFQFMPITFSNVNKKYFQNELLLGPATTARDFLFDPGRSAALWACWRSAREYPITERRDLAEALMQHQAGPGRLGSWRQSSYGQSAQADRDVEFMIEVARFAESRNFVSLALNDIAIAEAAGITGEVGGGGDSAGPCGFLRGLLNTAR